ncbi:hypothetical protein F383_23893 [Gossypium arboreum]|uniref:Uncharacterized protein n=1 Tax=Gossypium arboreum TaxID=29729 RepID=A0A0B0P6Z7_GOSAR|nr:hypothetical protein F383_23893 [Gossypium arboreum]
MGVCLSCE